MRTARRRAPAGGRHALVVVLLVLGALTLAGCGVPLESEAQPLPLAQPTAENPGPAVVSAVLWLVDDDQLVSVRRTISASGGPEGLLQALVAPVGPAESADGLRSAVSDASPDQPLVQIAENVETAPPIDPSPPGELSTSPAPTYDPSLFQGPVTVRLDSDVAALSVNEFLLALGQTVKTLGSAGYGPVSFINEAGAAISVQAPNAEALSVVYPADYDALLASK